MKEIRKELLDELLEGYEKPEDLLGDEGLLKGLQKALMERAFGAELTAHLGYAKGDPGGRGSGNNRNGHGRKRVLTESGSVDVSVPRDRPGTAPGPRRQLRAGDLLRRFAGQDPG